MFIVQTVFHRDKLRQERHGLEYRNYRTRRSLPAKHAAPDRAWMASGGLGCYKHATPTELLCPGPIPPETARNEILSVGSHPGSLEKAPCRSLFARMTLPPLIHRRSNTPMQAGNLAKAARPRPIGAKLMNQELIPSLGFNMNLAGKFSHVLNCSAE